MTLRLLLQLRRSTHHLTFYLKNILPHDPGVKIRHHFDEITFGVENNWMRKPVMAAA